MWDLHLIKKKEKNKKLSSTFFSEFWFSESKIYAFWFPKKWPTDGPSYDSATRMLSIKIVHYARG